MTNFEPKKLKNIWTIEDSISTYNIDNWGDKYFSINSKGNISIAPEKKSEKIIDLLNLVEELKSREINTPLIITLCIFNFWVVTWQVIIKIKDIVLSYFQKRLLITKT